MRWVDERGWLVVEEDELEDVGAHLEGTEVIFGRVVVDVDVFPSVAEVTLPSEEAYESTLVDECVGFWWMVVVFVDFGKAVREVVFLVEDGVREGELDPLEVGEDFLHLRHGVFFEAIVVVDVEETAAEEVGAEVVDFLGGEGDVAVAGDVDVGVVEEVAAADVDGGILRGEVHVELGVAEGDEVGEGGWVGVPIAAAAVFDESNGGLALEVEREEGEKEGEKERVFHSDGLVLGRLMREMLATA